MRLSNEEKKRREEEKAGRLFERRRSRLVKMIKGAPVSFDSDGNACLTYSDGQIFKCCGPLADAVFGPAPGEK